jgi:two-component system, OmpR family, sensor histidine kinase KdpD
VSQAATVDADAAGYVEAAGHFRIYLGSAPGVGKTYAMLSEGQRRRGRGADVVAGLVESYGRPLTEGLIHGLEVIPRKTADYRGTCLEEMDLDAVLRRHPEVALVDELAHTNVPGSGPHGKRWQDVLDILKAGIDVIATVNIQHLESVADEVEHMTGAKVGERVPDWVVRKADQIELIDSSPEQLRRRMLHGNIYPKDKVPQALTHFFRTDNLIALRELALRFVADESDEELLEHLRQHQSPALWETTERIVVAVTAEPGTDVLLRRAARIAFRFKAELDVVHVIVGDTAQPRDGRPIDALRALAADLGARWHEIEDDDPARALVSFARGRQATQIMLGSHQRGWWHVADGGPIARRVIHEAGAIGIDVHLIARSELPPTEASEPNAVKEISLPSLAAVRRDGAGEAIDGHRSVTRLGGHRADSYKTEAVLLQDAPRWPVPGVGINENADAGIVAADLGHEGGDQRRSRATADLRWLADRVVESGLAVECLHGQGVVGVVSPQVPLAPAGTWRAPPRRWCLASTTGPRAGAGASDRQAAGPARSSGEASARSHVTPVHPRSSADDAEGKQWRAAASHQLGNLMPVEVIGGHLG